MGARTYVTEDWSAFDDDLVTLIGATNTESCADYCARGWDTRPRGEVYVIGHVTRGEDVEGWWRVLLLVPVSGTDEILGYYAVGRLKEIHEWSQNCYGADHRRRVELRKTLDRMLEMSGKYCMTIEDLGRALEKYKLDIGIEG